jgi:tRNA threonylcarbamoyladenosine biosynthesis protein TsaE
MAEATLRLPDEAATLALGRALAAHLSQTPGFGLRLTGELGAGKTTLVRGLVAALPGGDQAEVASPSFNICNVYPTKPPVEHYDLYRVEQTGCPEELWERLEAGGALVAVEWAQYLPPACEDEDWLSVVLRSHGDGRIAVLVSAGEESAGFLQKLLPDLKKIDNSVKTLNE